MSWSDLGELLEHLVAGLGGRAVVHVLEVVDVPDDERERLTEAAGSADLLLERGLAEPAVREAGEGVDERLALTVRW